MGAGAVLIEELWWTKQGVSNRQPATCQFARSYQIVRRKKEKAAISILAALLIADVDYTR